MPTQEQMAEKIRQVDWLLKNMSASGPTMVNPEAEKILQQQKLAVDEDFQQDKRSKFRDTVLSSSVDNETKTLIDEFGGDVEGLSKIMSLKKQKTDDDAKARKLLAIVKMLKDIPAGKDWVDQIGVGASNYLDYYLQNNPVIGDYDDKLNAFLSTISKGVSDESGNTSDRDMLRAITALPSIYTKTAPSRRQGVSSFIQILEGAGRKKYGDDPDIRAILGDQYENVLKSRNAKYEDF